MKRILTTCLAMFCLLSWPLVAQSKQGDARHAEMKAKKIAFISDYVGMTSDEAQAFWPLYNEMDAKLGACRRCMGKSCRVISENSKDIDYLKAAEQIVKNDEDQAKIRREYHEKFLKILPAKKLYLYYQSEHQYKKYLMRQIQRGGNTKK